MSIFRKDYEKKKDFHLLIVASSMCNRVLSVFLCFESDANEIYEQQRESKTRRLPILRTMI